MLNRATYYYMCKRITHIHVQVSTGLVRYGESSLPASFVGQSKVRRAVKVPPSLPRPKKKKK